MKHPDKREKKKHPKRSKWWNDFTIFGDKKFAIRVSRHFGKGMPKRASGSIRVKLDRIYEDMKNK